MNIDMINHTHMSVFHITATRWQQNLICQETKLSEIWHIFSHVKPNTTLSKRQLWQFLSPTSWKAPHRTLEFTMLFK